MQHKNSNFSKTSKVLQWPLRVVKATVKLPAHIQTIYQVNAELKEQEAHFEQLTNGLQEQVNLIVEDIKQIVGELRSIDRRLAVNDRAQHVAAEASAALSAPLDRGRFADNHDLDNFYVGFEDKFRGSEDVIAEKVAIYPPKLKATGISFRRYPIVDLGCGRGELLSAFNKAGVRAIGLDINYEMVERAKAHGLEAVQGDALSYLRALEAESIGGITGMHLIEHIPFAELISLFKECFRVLVPGGLIVFETPNPENLMVGIYSFHMDPSHLKPLPPPLTGFALESVGFTNVEILRLHNAREQSHRYDDVLLADLAYRVFGPLDYAAIATKPGALKLKSRKQSHS